MSQRVLTSVATAAALVLGCVTLAAAQVPVRVGGDIKEPRRTTYVAPVYPPIAQQAGIQGIVIVEAVIGIDGAVQEARILRPVPMLDQAALDAVTQWRYAPTLLNGQPVPVVMTVTVSFSLGTTEKPREVNPDPLVMQRPPDDLPALLESVKSLRAGGQLAEAEATLQRALAVLQAERARVATQQAAGAAPAPVRVGSTIAEPILLKRVDPVYPTGTAPAAVTIAEIIVGADGHVTDVKILRSQSAEMNAAVVTALRQWQYRPTLLNGVAVPVIMTVTIK